MRLKTNLVISILFIALLGFVYFYEIKGGEERQAAAERDRQVLRFSDHEARRLTIDHGDSLVILERVDGAWRLTAPVATGADQSAVERYLRNLSETEVEGEPLQDSASVAAGPELLAEYGLDSPRLRVFLELTGEAAALDSLRFGDDTPTERFAYVQRSGPNPEVLRVRAWRFDNLQKGVFDLRDRRLLAFEQADVREVWLGRADEPPVEAMRAGDGWELVAPLARPADASAVDGLLSKVRNAQVEKVVYETPSKAELTAAGLAPGAERMQLVLRVGDDRAEKRLLVGVESEDGAFYARDSSRPHVFVIDSTVVGQLRKPVDELRDKHILRLQQDDVIRLELRREGALAFAAARDTAGSWRLDTSGREPKTWRLNSLITDLDGLEAKAFVEDAPSGQEVALAPYGLDAPRLAIRVERTDGETWELLVGASAEDGDAYLMRAGIASVLRVAGDDVETLDLDLDDVSTVVELDADTAEAESDDG